MTQNTNSSISLNQEEFELFVSYRNQINGDFERFKSVNLALTEQEDELRLAKHLTCQELVEFENKKKNSYEVLSIINKDIENARDKLNKIKKNCDDYERKIQLLEKKKSPTSRKELKKFRKFINRNRGWLFWKSARSDQNVIFVFFNFSS